MDHSSSLVLADLRRTLRTPTENGEKAGRRDALALFNEIAARNFDFQDRTLGVLVAGYVFRDPKEDDQNRPLLFRESGLSDAPALIFQLPWLWNSRKSKAWESLIDAIFFHWRRYETLALDPSSEMRQPEYFKDLPLREDESQSGLHRAEIRYRKIHGCHYCTLGEVSFFLYAWRLMVRMAERNGWDARLSEIERISPAGKVSARDYGIEWSMAVWAQVSTRELSWVKFLDQKSMDSELRSKWDSLSQIVDRNERSTNVWLDDLRSMLLITNGDGSHFRVRRSLRALLEYAGYVCNGHLSQILEILEHRDLGRLSIQELADIDSILQEAVWERFQFARLDDAGAQLDLRGAFENLHRLLRFPVMPYFYWTAIDKREKAHFVLPVWSDFAKSRRLRWSARIPKSLEECESLSFLEEIETNVTGCVVMGIRPIGGFDWTLGRSQGTNRTPRRLQEIISYFELLAVLPVDYVYYRTFFAKGNEVEERDRQRRSFAHRTYDLISSLRYQLLETDLKHYVGHTVAGLITVLSATVEVFRGLPCSLRKEFVGSGSFPLRTYATLAAYIALRRGFHNLVSSKAVSTILDKEDPASDLLELLKLAVDDPPKELAEAIRTESFGVMLVHSLGQALYHSLVYLCQEDEVIGDEERPRVRLKSESGLGRVDILNPGFPAERPGVRVRDQEELAELGRHFLPGGSVLGPTWFDDIGQWMTSFTIPLGGVLDDRKA